MSYMWVNDIQKKDGICSPATTTVCISWWYCTYDIGIFKQSQWEWDRIVEIDKNSFVCLQLDGQKKKNITLTALSASLTNWARRRYAKEAAAAAAAATPRPAKQTNLPIVFCHKSVKVINKRGVCVRVSEWVCVYVRVCEILVYLRE